MAGQRDDLQDTQCRSFGSLLRHSRVAAGLAQAELAERAGLSLNTVGGLERGEHQHPHPATVHALADALGLSDSQRRALVATLPRSELATRSNALPARLPASLSPLLGRDYDVDAIAAVLRSDDVRLVTLTGPGGVGKTTLAVEVATRIQGEYKDGVVFVPLAALHDPGLVVPTLLSAVGVDLIVGQAPLDRLVGELRHRHVLLVLDNFEHLLGAAPLVTDLLSRCPHLAVLVTSRAPLRVAGEQVMPVLSLPVPDLGNDSTVAELTGIASVDLFLTRVQASDLRFRLTSDNAGAVAAICQRLDGLPLAIELAAARCAVIGPNALMPLLARRLPLLTAGRRDAPARHQTMQASINWSYELLTEGEQTAFRRLAVFIGGATLEAASAVVEGDSNAEGFGRLAVLVEQHLLQTHTSQNGQPRFRMLETIREFARDKLAESAELEMTHAAHAAVFLDFAERTEPALYGPSQTSALMEMEIELGNIRAALTWYLEQEDAVSVLRIAGALWDFWMWRGHLNEGRQWLESGLALGVPLTAALRAKALQAAGHLTYELRDVARAQEAVEQSLVAYQEIGDRNGTGNALLLLGRLLLDRGDYDAAAGLLIDARRELEAAHQAAAAELDDVSLAAADYLMVAVTIQTGVVAYFQGDWTAAERTLGHGVELARAAVLTEFIAAGLGHLGRLAFDRGDVARAVAAHWEELTLQVSLGDQMGMAHALNNLAVVMVDKAPELAAQLLGASDRIRERVGLTPSTDVRPESDRRTRAQATARLGVAGFAAAWTAGGALSRAACITVAARALGLDTETTEPNAEFL